MRKGRKKSIKGGKAGLCNFDNSCSRSAVSSVFLISTAPLSYISYTAVSTKVVPQSAKAYATMPIGIMG